MAKERGPIHVEAPFSETECYELLRQVRWPGGITCPFCTGSRVTTHSKFARTPRQRYLCLGCRRTFSDLTGTPFAGTNLPLDAWFGCLRLLGSGFTTSELATALGVKWDTTAHIKRRLAVAAGRPGLVQSLRQIIEKGGHD